jgi:phage/plasmid-like protein (TIGR03299 family)
MPAAWESGFMVREPSWHRLENAVLRNSPKTWADARAEAGLTWDVGTEPVYSMDDRGEPDQIEGWQVIWRDDLDHGQEGWALAIQTNSYHVIRNEQFGSVIDAVVGRSADEDPVTFEALFALHGGRQIVALLYFDEPLALGDVDSSQTYTFLCLVSRHDGSGGLRGIPTNIRVQCANTLNQAEFTDGRKVGFTIRHTLNWEQKVADAGLAIQAARGDSQKWVEFAQALSAWKATPRQRDTFLTRLFPVSDDMGPRMADNQVARRVQIRSLLEGPTCAPIADNGYGLLMAVTEWADYYRAHQSTDSLISRQLMEKSEPKAKAARILRDMAKLKARN